MTKKGLVEYPEYVKKGASSMKKLLFIGLLVIAFLLVACGSVSSTPQTTPSATQPGTSAQPAAPTTVTPKTATPTPSGAEMPKIPGLGAENGPYIGGPLSLFVRVFGKPDSTDPDYVWNDIGSGTMLFADTTGNRVTNILNSANE